MQISVKTLFKYLQSLTLICENIMKFNLIQIISNTKERNKIENFSYSKSL